MQPTHRKTIYRSSPAIAALVILILAWAPAGAAARGAAQEEPQEQIESLGRALGMTPEEVEALGLSPEEIDNLLAGFSEETVVVGSRARPRTVTASPVPVDVLSTADLTSQGTVNLQDQLRTVVPSFSVNTQPISDASTVVRPAMLRNLAPDHTLVLVNGKRRHRSSIIDWHGGNGVAFGSQGPDISAIPAIALRQVEVLRDGAAAQYGSDAIAGVLNFQLKDAASGGAFDYNTGTFGDGDGEAMNVAANVGLPLGSTGFANLSLEYGGSNPTNRSAPRSDAIALIAAGNTDVASDTPQVWGSPDIEDDLKLFGNFGYTTAAGVQVYSHTNYASKRVTGGFFFRNPNTRGGVFSLDGGQTLLVGDALLANGMGSANCPTVAITDNVADPVALRQVFDDPNCFSFRERFPGGFTPSFGGEAQDMSLVGGVRGFTVDGFTWDISGSLGAHETDLFIRDTVNASLGPDTPTEFNLGSNRQRDIGLNADLSYAATDMINIAAGAEWRNEQYRTVAGDPESWTVGPYGRGQGFSAGSNGFFGYGPMAAGTWSRRNVALYGDVELNGAETDWTLGTAVRVEHFDDFGTTMNSKLSGRFRFVRASVSSGFRAPTPGQQNGFNISTQFDPALGDLVNNGSIPSISPVAALRGGVPLAPEKSINYTAGVVLDTGQFSLTADYFRINVSDRIGITSNFTLTAEEIDTLLAADVEAARDLRRFRFFTNAFSTASQGIDLVSTFTPLALRGNTTISAVFNYTDTEVTDNRKGLLNDRRLTEFAYALPRTRWNVGLTQQVGSQIRAQLTTSCELPDRVVGIDGRRRAATRPKRSPPPDSPSESGDDSAPAPRPKRTLRAEPRGEFPRESGLDSAASSFVSPDPVDALPVAPSAVGGSDPSSEPGASTLVTAQVLIQIGGDRQVPFCYPLALVEGRRCAPAAACGFSVGSSRRVRGVLPAPRSSVPTRLRRSPAAFGRSAPSGHGSILRTFSRADTPLPAP